MAAEKPHIIAIAGPSCAGKTETSKAVARVLNAPIIGLDSYYLDLSHLTFEKRTRFNFDEPSALDHNLLAQHLRALSSGCRVEIPVYDFAAHNRTNAIEIIEPAPFLILEGLFVLYWEDVRALCDTTVYVDAPDEICLERRKYRDVRERGRTNECVMRQYSETVRPMAAKYVWPTKDLAQLVVSGTESLDRCASLVIEEISRKARRELAHFSVADH